MFTRLEKIIGNQNLEKIKNTSVMIVGIGGVGGYVTEALVRSGIEKLIIIDHDFVDITNKNRQIIALDSTIGRKKVEVMKERILDINANCKVMSLDLFLDQNNTKDIISKYHPDYVIDACDTVTTKREIIMACLKFDIFLISSMGTGNKLDPSKLRIDDIRKTSNDPLAKVLRKWVNDQKIKGKIPVLWSNEVPIKIHDRVPGSTSFVPSSAGLKIAAYVINNIINK